MSHARQQFQGRLDRNLEAIRERGLFRSPSQQAPSPFCHNDYLGLQRHPDLIDALCTALGDGLPTTASGSRLLSGNLSLFTEFENAFAQAAGFPSGLVLASASEANRVGICAIVGRGDTAIHDALAHASLIDGIMQSGAQRRKFRHNDPEDLRAQLRQSASGLRLVVTESVFSMDGDVAPLDQILQVCNEEDALLFVDEAHAVGVFGQAATGLAEALPHDAALIASTHGFGKALASSGGMLCTVPEVLQTIQNTSRAFIYTTAPSPLATYAARWCWSYSRTHPERRRALERNVREMETGLLARGLCLPGRTLHTPILPVHANGLVRALAWSEILHKHGFPLRPIRPPSVPTGTERLRLTASADLTSPQIQNLLEAMDVCLSSAA
jgi:7-keto-8-aminopelargonate synthetase-like enzyme